MVIRIQTQSLSPTGATWGAASVLDGFTFNYGPSITVNSDAYTGYPGDHDVCGDRLFMLEDSYEAWTSTGLYGRQQLCFLITSDTELDYWYGNGIFGRVSIDAVCAVKSPEGGVVVDLSVSTLMPLWKYDRPLAAEISGVDLSNLRESL